jgi:WavE lipopolysaccharide synthesis
MSLLSKSYRLILNVFFIIVDASSKFLLRKFNIRFTYKIDQLDFENLRLTNVPGRRMNFLNRQLEVSDLGRNQEFSHLNNPFGSEICILLQGPTHNDDPFLESAVARYTALFPEASIVISTWSGVSINFNRRYNNLCILYSDKPDNPGISNVNLQIETTRAGIKYASKINAKYVLKSRTDQIFLSPLLLIHLHNVVDFPKNRSNVPRFVVSSLNTFCFRPYSISDMFMFGKIEHMVEYWDIPFDTRLPNEIADYRFDSLALWAKARLAENYLSSKFLENRGETLDFTLEHYYKILSKYFVVLNSSSIGQMWPKYSNFDPASNPNNFPNRYSEVTYEIWNNLEIYAPNLIESAKILSRASG